MRQRIRSTALWAIAIAGCSGGEPSTPADGGAPPPDGSPAYDAVWQISTHNAYWVNRGATGDLFASGAEERLADQLALDHARAVEIDIHKDPEKSGRFLVYHTVPGNGLCTTLEGCLAKLRAFHYAVPRHEALHVTLELKELTAPNFDAHHTIEDLDRVLEDELGPLLYRPSDLLARCPTPEPVPLGACLEAVGWPSIHALRGKFIISVLGNWNGLPGAQATRDFVDYAASGRAAFPMASSWQLDRGALLGAIHELVTQDELDMAYRRSVFLQIEDTADPSVPDFLTRHGVVRVDGAFTAEDQRARIGLRMQLLQTDSPEVQDDDRGPAEPMRAFDTSVAGELTREPGARLRISPSAAGDRVFAHAPAGADSKTAWEAMISSGVDASRIGCLRAAASLGAEGETSITACRTKIAAIPGGESDPDAERVVVVITVCRDGACAAKQHASIDPDDGGPGDLLRIEVENHAGAPSCARVLSASDVDRGLSPVWAAIGAEECFSLPLVHQGLSVPAGAAPGWFFGARRDGGGGLEDVTPEVFEAITVEPAAGAPHGDPSLLHDDGA